MRTRLLTALAISCATLAVATPAAAQLSVGISVNFGPPALPIYAQPAIPGPDYIWTPGYWAWDNVFGDYFWVPGAWVRAPQPGLLWTPAWWGWSNGAYLFHAGYWGPHVGFYGGIAYGFGYTGFGYQGGYWNGGHVFYNRTVNNITNVSVTNVYNRTVVNNNATRVSYNGGPGGIAARPSPAEMAFAHEQHFASTGMQRQQISMAHNDPRAFAHANGGHPPRPGMAAAPGPAMAQHVAAPRPAAPAWGNGAPPQRQMLAAPANPRPNPNQGDMRPPQGQPQPHWAPRPDAAFAGQHMAGPPAMHATPQRPRPPQPHPAQPHPHPHPHGEEHHDHG